MWLLEQYVNPRDAPAPALVLNADRWTLEVYRTVIGTLQSAAWMLLVVFVFLLVAYVVARGLELRAGRGGRGPHSPPPASRGTHRSRRARRALPGPHG